MQYTISLHRRTEKDYVREHNNRSRDLGILRLILVVQGFTKTRKIKELERHIKRFLEKRLEKSQ